LLSYQSAEESVTWKNIKSKNLNLST